MERWYETWFDSDYYPILYQQRDKQEAHAFLKNLFGSIRPGKNSKILDLACGRGRHCAILADLGFRVHGADYSAKNILECRRSCPGIHFYQHDMRKELPYSYDLVLNLFTSFGYFETDAELFQTLSHISKALKPGGLFVLDYLNVNHIRNNLVQDETCMKKGIEFKISRYLDKNRICKNITIVREPALEFKEEVIAYTKNDLIQMMEEANLLIGNIFGSYELGPFDEAQSDRLIIVAKKC
jgi:SAM-dependent methyltransferase